MDALGLRIDNLCFWNEITTGDITTKEERKAAFLATKPKRRRIPILPEHLRPKTEEEIIWDEEFECLEMERIPRKFPATNTVYHFHPIAFAEQMMLITGGRAPWMEVAIAEAIKHKGLDENTGALAKAVKEQYHTYTGHSNATGKTSWCASFASWCLGQSKFDNPKSWSSQAFIDHKTVKKTEIIYGAIAVFTDCDKEGNTIYNEHGYSFGHVTFVVGSLDNGQHACIGGNQGNKIKVSNYDCSGKVFAKNRAKTKWRKLTGLYVPKKYKNNGNDDITEQDNFKTIDEANKKIIKTKVETSDYEST